MEALAGAAFAAGLLGGVHCAGMCGGIVATLSAGARGPILARQVGFNAGRILSYAVAGGIAGLATTSDSRASTMILRQTCRTTTSGITTPGSGDTLKAIR